jgi:hypothetical protein
LILVLLIFYVVIHCGPLMAEQPRLVLLITIDQLRGDMPWRIEDRFGPSGFRLYQGQGCDYPRRATRQGLLVFKIHGAICHQHLLLPGISTLASALECRRSCGPIADQKLGATARQGYLRIARSGRPLVTAEKVGSGEQTDLLAVSFSVTDYIGHGFGPNSLEAEDNLLRLDQTLQELFHFIDGTVGLENTLIAL